jgi:hypothetical protein
MRLALYTCVLGGYDRVFEPVLRDTEVDFFIVTDDAGLSVPGWRTIVVDPSQFGNCRAANRHFKFLGHAQFADYDASIYIDGNIRVLGQVSLLAKEFLASRAALGVYCHPTRNSVAQEIVECVRRGQVPDAESAFAELEDFKDMGFPDAAGLIEAGVLLKNHRHDGLVPAMRLWWQLFEKYRSRDQFSLPFVIWKQELPCFFVEQSFRAPNPYFGLYPHYKAGNQRYAQVVARSYDSPAYRLILQIWNAKWGVQRSLRRLAARTR